jgi:hypothetical protein
MSKITERLNVTRNARFLIVLVLIVVFLATTAYGVMSDSSVHGISTRISNVDRYCTTGTGTLAKNVTFQILASVWSASSLHTSISNVVFSLTVDGTSLGTFLGKNASWEPGGFQSFSMIFADPTATPQSLPSTSTLGLSMSAQASAGIVSAPVTASDKTVQAFGSTSC